MAPSLGPAVIAVRDRLRREIADGELAPGARMGAEREIAQRLEVSRSTVRAALAELERTGAIRRVRGRAGGIFVAERKVERDLTSLAGLPAYLRRQGFQSDARVISTATLAAEDEVAAALALGAGALVHEVVRVRLADGEPISLERASCSRPTGSRACWTIRSAARSTSCCRRSTDWSPERPRSGSRSSPPALPRRGCSGCPAALRCVAISRTGWSADGVPFERSHDLFRGDRVRIVVRARSAPKTASVVAASVEVL